MPSSSWGKRMQLSHERQRLDCEMVYIVLTTWVKKKKKTKSKWKFSGIAVVLNKSCTGHMIALLSGYRGPQLLEI